MKEKCDNKVPYKAVTRNGRRNSTPDTEVAQNGKLKLNAALVVILGASVLAMVLMLDESGRDSSSGNSKSSNQPASATAVRRIENDRLMPRTLDQLLLLSDSDVEKVDIARMNLVCAQGLSGAENLEINFLVDQLDSWAARIKLETDRYLHKYQQNPGNYENSQAYFRMLMLLTRPQIVLTLC